MLDPRAEFVRVREDDIGSVAHFADANQRREAELESLGWASATGINEPHDPRSLEITGFQAFDPKACGLHQVIRLAVEMAAARNALPDWREPVMPSSHADFRCAAMFGEAKDAPGLRTRRISESVLTASLTVQSVKVITTVSMLLSSSGKASPEPRRSSTGTWALWARS